MESFLFNYLNNWGDWVYLLIFLGMLIEGNATVFIVGFSLSSQLLNPLFSLCAVFAGAMVEQFTWFWIGIKFKNSSSRIAGWVTQKSNHFDEHFLRRPKTTLLVSKFIYGIHRAAIARAGVLGIKITTYLKYITPVLLLWMLAVGMVGYLAKTSLALWGNYLRYIEIAFLSMLATFILIERFIISGRLKRFWKKI